MYYITTDTIEKAFECLSSIELKEPSTAFPFFIMKACGINKLTYETPNFSEKNGLYYASRLSALFTPEEIQPKKYDFMNPFTLKEWPSQPVSEPLKKWVTSRLKNNILGGGMQWRSIIDIDTREGNKIKFKYDYVNILKNEVFDSQTINLFSLAIWSNRFCAFNNKVTARELCDEFIKTYNIDVDENNAFFNSRYDFELEFSDIMHDAARIRSMIGGTKPVNAWQTSDMTDTAADHIMSSYNFDTLPSDLQKVTPELIKNLLIKYSQVILEGPPGTSKSFFASEISKDYDEVIHVQFHPQYSYQNFVGGYIVDKSDVVYKKGVLLNLLDEEHYDANKQYLVIIDEFNRANVSQVLGEAIQCLDRGQKVDIQIDGVIQSISLPTNIHIIATLNTTDRTLGTIDYAIKRRFMSVYCPAEPNILIDLCPSSGFISLCDFLKKLNSNILRTTGNRDLSVGHAIFLSNHVKRDDKYYWDFEEFRELYNYKILPMIEDYCSNNKDMVQDIVGYKLSSQLDNNSFITAIKEFMEI